MPPLPPNDYANDSLWHRAYDRCQRLEQVSGNVDLKTILARLLGYMVREAPTDIGRTNISQDIIGCSDESELYILADMYMNHFVRCLRSKRPEPSFHLFRPFLDDEQTRVSYSLEEAPKNPSAAREKALIRDGYRCILSGKLDAESYITRPAALQIYEASPSAVSATQAAYIFPDLTNRGITGDNEGAPKNQHSSTVWTVMERFGQVYGEEELDGSNIHRLENVMTLNPDLYEFFDTLHMWLEPTDKPNQYKITATSDVFLIGLPQLVTFTTSDAKNLPLPSPRYLALHAACVRVLNLSGAAKRIDAIEVEMEKLSVLASDGSSADVLSFALGQLAIVV
ncbi:hypothetical protein JAAARDRAFT_190164 [Jaapia argillacea MUCL 33604]|uniref:HNH nuclease domain-containing protein n=1 Tax=Jaapia argillacea MUCL 33604 TaxID=933084 RepID=A0A067QFK7_9AGAM|nr:hypothetical protein JAAARDRAFT_190164 [Jaapia argillacea MUCL 33604]